MAKRAKRDDDLTLAELAAALDVDDELLLGESRETVTQAELAERLGITDRAVRNLHELGIPRVGTRYPWPAACKWWDAYCMRQGNPVYRRTAFTLADALRELAVAALLERPADYVVVPRLLWEALAGARIRIDRAIIRRLAPGSARG
jgi:hypothetical protein